MFLNAKKLENFCCLMQPRPLRAASLTLFISLTCYDAELNCTRIGYNLKYNQVIDLLFITLSFVGNMVIVVLNSEPT